MKKLTKYLQKMGIQVIHKIFHIIKVITNVLAYIYQDKQTRVFLNKLILQEN